MSRSDQSLKNHDLSTSYYLFTISFRCLGRLWTFWLFYLRMKLLMLRYSSWLKYTCLHAQQHGSFVLYLFYDMFMNTHTTLSFFGGLSTFLVSTGFYFVQYLKHFFFKWEYCGCYQTMWHKLLHFLSSPALSPWCFANVNTMLLLTEVPPAIFCHLSGK